MEPREGPDNGILDGHCLHSMMLDLKKVLDNGFLKAAADDTGPREVPNNGVFDGCCFESMTLDCKKVPAMGLSKAAATI